MKLTMEQAAIKLDIDGPAPSVNELVRLLIRAGYKPFAMWYGRSPSGKGWHVVIHVRPRPTSPHEVVALQAILGGDPNREAMQMERAKAFPSVPMFMRDAWNVLYAPHHHRMRHLHLRRTDDD